MKKFAKRATALILTVMMAVGMLTLGASAADAGDRFTDVAGSDYAEAIEALASDGIVNGVGDGKYGTDQTLTRAEVVTVLGRMAGAEQKDTDRFSDVDNGTWYSGYVGWAEENGIVEGVGDGLFDPWREITGYELDLMLSRYAKLVGIGYTADSASLEPLTRGEMAQMVYDVIYEPLTIRTTTYGDVQGLIDTSNGTLAWLGVPYGTAGRWEAPAATSWTGVKDCVTSGPMSIQPNSAAASGGPPTQGEADCLNLDIYAQAGAEGKPVLVFLHGGNNQTGSANGEFKGQDVPVIYDCVFVSLNFRTGPQGFNPLPALKTGESDELDSGNYTLLDIAFALEWIQKNIDKFGGDPDNVTISGHSAGGRNVMAMLISPLFEGRFDKALVSSGGMTVADEEKSAVQFANYLAPLAVRDGKAETTEEAVEWLLTDGEEVANYLKGLSDADLIGCFESNAGIRMALFPHLFNDGAVLPEEGFATTEYNSVPVMMMAGTNEFSFFGGVGAGKTGPDSVLNDSTLDADAKAAATAFSVKYGSDMYRIFNGQMSADAMYKNYDAPIYVCQPQYVNNAGSDLSGHGDMFKLFMDPEHNKENGWTHTPTFGTPGGQQAFDLFTPYLKNFLHSEDGDPNGDNTEVEWTPWDSSTKLSMVIDGNDAAATAAMKNVSTTYADIIKAMEEDDTLSEELKMRVIHTAISGRWFSEAQDEYFGVPSFWYADQIAAEKGTLYIQGYDEGAYVTKVIFTLPEEVDSVSALGAAVSTKGKSQQVTGAYLSDGKGEPVEGSSVYVTLELDLTGLSSNDLFISPDDGHGNTLKEWVAEYNVTATFAVEQDGARKTVSLDANCIDNRVAPEADLFEKGTYTVTSSANPLTGEAEEVNIHYAAYAPDSLKNDGAKNPLIIWLHGAGEGGNVPEAVLLANEAAKLACEDIQSYFTTEGGAKGAYVFVPQTESVWMDRGDGTKSWGDVETRYTEALMNAIEKYVAENGDIDVDRIYIGGASNGGYMTVNMMIEYPDYWAAGFPVCSVYAYNVWQTDEEGHYIDGDVDRLVPGSWGMQLYKNVPSEEIWMTAEKIEAIKDIPVWFVHSVDDPVVTPDYTSMPIYRALVQAGAENAWFSLFEHALNADLTVGPTFGHAVWQNLFNDAVKGVQDVEAIKDSTADDKTMGFAPSDATGGGASSNGYDSIFEWMNAQSK